MAVSLVQGKVVDATGVSVAFASLTPTAGNLLTQSSKAGALANTMGCSDPTNTWAGIDIANTSDTADECASFYAANVAGSAVVVTITCTVAGHSMRGILEEYSGVATASPLQDHGSGGSNTGTTGTISTNSTTTSSGDLVVAWLHPSAAGETITAGSGYTQGSVVPAAGGSKLSSEWAAAGSSGTQTATATWGTTGGWAGLIATFKAAGGAVSTLPLLPPPTQVRFVR